jgi:DNA-binding NtrC family response regulator
MRTLNRAPLSDTHRHMAENAILFLDRIQALSEDQRVRLVRFIIQRCLLVVVSTPDLDSAYRIFSVLNV